MNNRDIPHPKVRGKRSYEFLMGLINNNSRYEVTKVDPSAIVTEKPEVIRDNNVAASELLLELMVRIAAHPDQWEKVHQLLQKLDEDLLTSKNFVEKIGPPGQDTNENEQHENFIKKDDKQLILESENPVTQNTSRKVTANSDASAVAGIKWPYFEENRNVKIVNSSSTSSADNKYAGQKGYQQGKGKSTKPPYHKNFAYHRVTGTPFNLDKSPKAYIAVSVIAPKPVKSVAKEDDVTLENELHQLNKPWSHIQNLKNMEAIRSRWVIQTSDDVKSAS